MERARLVLFKTANPTAKARRPPSQNAITQDFLAEYTTQEGSSVYYVSEVGALIAIAWVATKYLFWRKRHALPIRLLANSSAGHASHPVNRYAP